MAIRDKKEHSYRTLAIQTLGDAIRSKSAEALAAVNVEKARTGESKLGNAGPSVVLAVSLLTDMLRAITWLESLDEALCPEVMGAEMELLSDLLSGKEPQAILDELLERANVATDKAESLQRPQARP